MQCVTMASEATLTAPARSSSLAPSWPFRPSSSLYCCTTSVPSLALARTDAPQYKAGNGQNAVEPRRIDGEIDSTLDQSIDEEKKA